MDNSFFKKIIILIAGLIVLSLGIALFKISNMGNDSHTAMVMAIGGKIGIKFAIVMIVVNAVWFIVELVFGSCYIGIGTFAHWIGVGIGVSLWIDFINRYLVIPKNCADRLIIMILGMLVLSLGVSLYQTCDLGIVPYDVLSIIMSERLPIPYFWCRIITDTICVVIALFFDGLIGIGTMICVLGLGPFITFFNKHISQKIV